MNQNAIFLNINHTNKYLIHKNGFILNLSTGYIHSTNLKNNYLSITTKKFKLDKLIFCTFNNLEYTKHLYLQHIDGNDSNRLAGILIYLNEEWDENWGGNLILRDSKITHDKTTAYKVIPTFGKVVIIDLEIFDTSHAVDNIIGDHNRCTLLSFATSKTKRKKLDKIPT